MIGLKMFVAFLSFLNKKVIRYNVLKNCLVLSMKFVPNVDCLLCKVFVQNLTVRRECGKPSLPYCEERPSQDFEYH